MLKLLWNLSAKTDNLWVKWIHTYYMKHEELFNVENKANYSWIMKDILKQREVLLDVQGLWNHMHTVGKLSMKKMYLKLNVDDPKVLWNCMFNGNKARPRAQMMLWLVCHGKLATKSRLYRLKLIDNMQCYFCDKEETLNHLLFGFAELRIIWQKVITWIHFHHDPMEWDEEIKWLMLQGKGKVWKVAFIKLSMTGNLYEFWQYRNTICFGQNVNNRN